MWWCLFHVTRVPNHKAVDILDQIILWVSTVRRQFCLTKRQPQPGGSLQEPSVISLPQHYVDTSAYNILPRLACRTTLFALQAASCIHKCCIWRLLCKNKGCLLPCTRAPGRQSRYSTLWRSVHWQLRAEDGRKNGEECQRHWNETRNVSSFLRLPLKSSLV